MKNIRLEVFLVFSNGKKVCAPNRARTFKELREWATRIKSLGSKTGLPSYFAFQRFNGPYAIKGIWRLAA